MKYQVLNQDANLPLIQRLFAVRNISDNPKQFLNPNLKYYRRNPFSLNDMEKGVQRIIQAMKNQEKIMIF